MFRFRDLVHTKDEATIPSNLRAAEPTTFGYSHWKPLIKAYLKEHPSASMAELAKSLGVTPPTASRWALRMEEDGLVTKDSGEYKPAKKFSYSKKRTLRPESERRAAVLTYMKDNPGKEFTAKQLQKVFGYATLGAATSQLNRMQLSGQVFLRSVHKGRVRSNLYRLLGSQASSIPRPDLDKGDEKNGPVYTTIPTPTKRADQGVHRASYGASRERALEFLVSHGPIVTIKDYQALKKHMGYKLISSAHSMMYKMAKAGYAARLEKGYGPLADPAPLRKPGVKPALTPSSAPSPANPVEVQPTADYKRFDYLLWEYVKEHGDLPSTILQGLIAFSKWLKERMK